MNSNAQLDTIAKLDFTAIKMKLMHKESGEGWTQKQADAVAFDYRRFLSLTKLFPHEQIAPRFDVDIFWHYHILDTMKYAVDCHQVFGHFLHHFPYSGLEGKADDAAIRDRTGTRTQELYEATFGAAYIGDDQLGNAAVNVPGKMANAAWCQGAMATSAWCHGTMSPTAWCQGLMTKSAWCQGALEKTSWCQGVMMKAAWCQGAMAIAGGVAAAAQNDIVYSRQTSAMAA
ncbi:glycine-rich domain-containing protein [Massilia sp. TWR1-2-2]|uniref:glycine-rich domain-containing protein n=1 Tax=Massilia sp. TWR1-2-2 TaxID=2804584 RepID=UPI003CF0B9AC